MVSHVCQCTGLVGGPLRFRNDWTLSELRKLSDGPSAQEPWTRALDDSPGQQSWTTVLKGSP